MDELSFHGYFCQTFNEIAKEMAKYSAGAFRAKDCRVIFNPPATILFVGGKKYVSKAHNEEFDEEKGLLMCLAKANGISHFSSECSQTQRAPKSKQRKITSNDQLKRNEHLSKAA